MDDLEHFLTGEEPDTQAEPEQTAEPETIGQQRDEQGRFAGQETGEETPQETAEPVPPTEQGLPPEEFKGLKEERRKRQEAEQRIATLEQQIQARQQPQEPPAPPPSMWEDEQGWQQHFGQQVAQAASFNAKLDMSEMLNRHKHEDFDAIKASFLEMAQQNPALAQQALGDADPWGKAYQIAKNAATMAELGATDVSSLEAKLREKIMAEMQAQQPAANLPQSLAADQSARSASTGIPRPPSLDEILGR